MGKEKNELNAKQKIFCEEYSKHGNGSLAYKTAYPTCKKDDTARANASKLLANANIKKYIENFSNINTNKRIATLEEIREFWTNMLNNSEVKSGDRIKASELLYKAQGGFVEKQNDKKTTFSEMSDKYADS